MAPERRGEAEHEADDDSRDGEHEKDDALERQYAENEGAEREGQPEEQPAEEAEDGPAVDPFQFCAHPGFTSS